MVSYKITVTDVDGDKLKIETNGTDKCNLEGNKFTLNIDSNKIKRLVDSVAAMNSIMTDFNFKELNIQTVE